MKEDLEIEVTPLVKENLEGGSRDISNTISFLVTFDYRGSEAMRKVDELYFG